MKSHDIMEYVDDRRIKLDIGLWKSLLILHCNITL